MSDEASILQILRRIVRVRFSSEESQTSPMRKFLSWLKKLDTQISLFVGVVIGGGAVFLNIRSATRQTVLDGSYVETVSRMVRPFMWIDARGSIRSDHGAAELLSQTKFSVTTNPVEMRIVFEFKSHHQNPPMVRPMTGHLYVHSVSRGKGNDWEVGLRAATVQDEDGVGHGWMRVELIPEYSFLVEVLP